MKKILYIVSTLKRSGPTNQLYNIIKNLDRFVFEPIVVTLSSEPNDSKWKDYEALGISMHSLNLSRIEGLFLAKSKLELLVNELKPDLIHTQGIRADVLSSQLKIKIPKVSTIRNFPQKDFLMTYGVFLGRWMVWRQIRALKLLNVCVGVSSAVSENLKSNFGVEHSQVISNGVDMGTYHPVNSEQKVALRGAFNILDGARVWIVSGHLSDRKDPLFLINLWKQNFKDNKNDLLVLIGGGDLEVLCREAAKGYDNIRILGRVSNVSEYLQLSDYYLAASRAEGLPNAALEAMACGLPLLMSDIEPHKELIEMDSDIGMVYKTGDMSSFKEQFVRLLKHDSQTMKESCLNIVSSKLSSQIMSNNYQYLYNQLISGQ